MRQSWFQFISPDYSADGAALSNSTTLTDISPTPNEVTPANFLYDAGMRLWVHAAGRFSATSTPTLKLGLYYGGVAGTDLADTGAVTVFNATNGTWLLDAFVQVRATGASGSLLVAGQVIGIAAATSTSPLPATAPAAVTVDLTSSKAITVGATWGAAAAGNSITVHDFFVASIN